MIENFSKKPNSYYANFLSLRMLKNMSIASKFNLISMTLVFITILTVSYVVFSRVEKSLELVRLAQLESIALLKVEKIQTLVIARKADIGSFQGYFNVKTNLPIMSQYQKDRSAPIYLQAKKILDDQLKVFLLTHQFIDLMLLNREGEVVYAANPAHFEREIDRLLPDPDNKAFEEGKKNIYITEIFEDVVDGFKFFISAPVRDFQEKFIGVVVFGIDLASNFRFIQDTTGLGKTGETLIGKKLDNNLIFLNTYRHQSNANSNQKLDKEEVAYPMRQAVEEKEGSGVSIDYRGKEVLAVWRFIPELNLGLVAKIDIEETYASITQLKRSIFFIAITLLFITFLLSSWLSKELSKPIIQLSDLTKQVGLGDLTQSMTIDSEDEIGQLANSFNKMTADLKKITASRDDLNKEIAKRRKTEDALQKSNKQLLQVQKMEAIGSLAGGIAHDFNNILTAIIGYTEITMNNMPRESENFSNLDQVYKAGNRAKELVKHILVFSRKSEQVMKPMEPYLIIKEALKLLRATLPSTIEIREDIDTRSGTILADPVQIHQVIMNLCTNAGHAMRKKGGVLGVVLEAIDIDADFAATHENLQEGTYLRLSVSDSGHGIDKIIADRIFDPFFTTKGVGEGTGMGLSVVHGIVTSYGGAITVDSKPGKGSTFLIYLPQIESTESKEILLTQTPQRGDEKILFVDDEEPIARWGKKILEQFGYEVTTRTSSVEALEAFKATPQKFHLVITDLTMPNMTGDEFASKLLSIRPDIPIILCTGFSQIITEEKAKKMGIREFLKKPLMIKDLTAKIRQVLDQ